MSGGAPNDAGRKEAPLWAIAAFFDPAGDRRRLSRYRIFRRQLGVPLVTVELVRENTPALGAGDADVLVQVPGDDVMWQRERLLTIGLGAVPPGVRCVAWIDADIVLERADWPALAVRRLEDVPAVQLCDEIVEVRPRRDAPAASPLAGATELGSGPSLVRRLAGGSSDVLANALARGAERPAAERVGAGIGWAFRREAIAAAGFYNGSVVGGNDRAMACALVGRLDIAERNWRMSSRRRDHYLAWATEFRRRVGGAPASLPQRAFHLWHGDLRRRGYGLRHQILARHAFDPFTDVAENGQGCLQWSSAKPAMHREVRDFLLGRESGG